MNTPEKKEKKSWLILDLALMLSFFSVATRVMRDVQIGGNSWKQGDYLINNLIEPVRRGHFGSVALWVSDTISLNPLIVVAFFQILMLLILYYSFREVLKYVQNVEIALLLLLSSSIFVTFWVADPQGSVRKELIAFAGLALLSSGALSNKNYKILMGTFLFCVAIVAHEAMILLTPTFLTIIILKINYKAHKWLYISSANAVILCSAYMLFYTKNFGQIIDPMTICQPLLERGLREDICGGAISWLKYDASYGASRVSHMLDTIIVIKFISIYLISLLPLIIIAINQKSPRIFLFSIAITALPFIPLYFVAVDWGRWVSMHIFSATIIFVVALGIGKAEVKFKIKKFLLYGTLALGVLFSPGHVVGIVEGGALKGLVKPLIRAFIL